MLLRAISRSLLALLLCLTLSPGSSTIRAADAFRRGDSNLDESVDVSDPIYLLNFLYLGGPAVTCPDAADGNDDGRVDLSDAVAVLMFLFQGGSLPPPVGECGPDPTPDALEACVAPEGYCAPRTPPILIDPALSPEGPFPVLAGEDRITAYITFRFEDAEADIVDLRTTLTRPTQAPETSTEDFTPDATSGGVIRPFSLDASFVAGVYELELVLVDAAGLESDAGVLGFEVSAEATNVIEITSIAPTGGSPGDRVLILGRGFVGDEPADATTVHFEGDVAATILSVTDTAVEVIVPPQARSGPIRVARRAGEALSGLFTVPARIVIPSPFLDVSPEETVTVSAEVEGEALAALVWTLNGETMPPPEHGVLEADDGPIATYTAPAQRPAGGPLRLRCAASDDPTRFDEVVVRVHSPSLPRGEATVTAATGGVLEGLDGRSSLEIPPGALSQDARLSVRLVDPETLTGRPRDLEIFGVVEIAEVDPEGGGAGRTTLLSPATLTLPMTRTERSTKDLSLFSWSEAEGLVDTGAALVIHEAEMTATAEVAEFGTYLGLSEVTPGHTETVVDHMRDFGDLLSDLVAEVPEGLGENAFLMPTLYEGLRTPVYIHMRDGPPTNEPVGPFLGTTSARLVFFDGITPEVPIDFVQPSADGWEVGLIVPVPVLPDCDGPTLDEDGLPVAGADRTARIEIGYDEDEAWVRVRVECLCELDLAANAPPPDPLPYGVRVLPHEWDASRLARLRIEDAIDEPLRFSRLTVGAGTVLSWAFDQGPQALLDRAAHIEVSGDVLVAGTIRWTGRSGLYGRDGEGNDTGGVPRTPSALFHGGLGGHGGPWWLAQAPSWLPQLAEVCPSGCWILSGEDGADGKSAGANTGGRGGAVWERPSVLSTILTVTALVISLPSDLLSAAIAAYDLVNEVQLYEQSDENMRASTGSGGNAARPFVRDDLELIEFLPPRGGGGGGGSGKAQVRAARDHAGGSGGGGGGGAPGLSLVVGGELRIEPGGMLDGRGGSGGPGGSGDDHEAAPGGGGGGGTGAQIVLVANRIRNHGAIDATGGRGGASGKIVEGDLGVVVPKGFGVRGDGGLLRFQAPYEGLPPRGFSGVYNGPFVWLEDSRERVVVSTSAGQPLAYAFLGNVESFDARRIVYGAIWSSYDFYRTSNGERHASLESLEAMPEENGAVAFFEAWPVAETPGAAMTSLGVEVDRAPEPGGHAFLPVHPWERVHVFRFPGAYDSDEDGLFDGLEAKLGTDPHDADTDGDDLTDWEEVMVWGTDPTEPTGG